MTASTPALAATLVQTQDAAGNWSAPCALGDVCWCGAPLTLTAAQVEALLAGRPVRFDSDWYAKVRLAAPVAAPVALVAPTPRFTCPTCGGHRDTTLAGQCDDCGN